MRTLNRNLNHAPLMKSADLTGQRLNGNSGQPPQRVNSLRLGRPSFLLSFALPVAAWLLGSSAQAVIKEPDNLLWGSIVLGTNSVTATQTNIVVEARRSLSEPPLASYRMGSSPAAGNLYSLAVPLESLKPISDPKSTSTGDQIIVLVRSGNFVRYLTLFTVSGRGQITHLDLGDVDGDRNGLVDNWERQYFGASGQDPNGDPDRDGVSNLNEMLGGTNPVVPDSRHPADLSPTNNVISIDEVAKYALAWKTGQPWLVAPTNIPVEFVARAGYLWKNGESYKLETNNLAAGAPLWWTNVPPPGAKLNGTTDAEPAGSTLAKQSLPSAKIAAANSQVIRSVSDGTGVPKPVAITLKATPSSAVSAYVVEEVIPEGWTPGAISNDGVFDAAHRRIRWGLFFDKTERVLSYQLTSKSSAVAAPYFSGVGSFDGWNVVTAGADALPGTPRLLLGTPEILANGRVTVRFTGEAGARYEIQVSSDLKQWTVVATVAANADGKLEFTEDLKSGSGARFFRAQRLPGVNSSTPAQ
jgi:hypothetical protein